MRAFRRAPAYRGHVHIGFGLFAVRTIQSGELVLRMDRRLLRLYSPRQWEAFRGKFRYDAAIWRRGKLVSDFQHGKRQPAWCGLNHKRRPNLEMVWRKGAIEWRALCRIPKGAELGFDYGDVQGCGFR